MICGNTEKGDAGLGLEMVVISISIWKKGLMRTSIHFLYSRHEAAHALFYSSV